MTLTMALAVLGGLVLAGVIGHGAWSTRHAQPRRPKATEDDSTPRVEPQLGAAREGGADAAAAGELRAGTVRRNPRLDALIDELVPLRLDAPVRGEMVLAHMPASQRAGTKPFYIEGLDSESGEWDTPQPQRSYGELQAGVQLANRSGAMNEIEYSEFVQKVQAFAEGVGAMPDFPDMLDAVGRARELDTFASPLDAQLAVTLRSHSVAWSVGFVQQCAARLGFVPGTLPGRLVLPAAEEGAPPVLVLGFDAHAALADNPQDAAVRHLSLSLDVPQTPASAEPFPAWHNAARTLCDDMDAELVDDAGQVITLQAFATIGQELQQLYSQLETRDLTAGSPVARRLFSGGWG